MKEKFGFLGTQKVLTRDQMKNVIGGSDEPETPGDRPCKGLHGSCGAGVGVCCPEYTCTQGVSGKLCV
jgi:hypothetical protein